MDFAVLADHRVKIKENEKSGKYLDLAKEQKKKLWNMKMMIVLIVIGALGMIPKDLVKNVEELETGGRAGTLSTVEVDKTLEKNPGDL